MKKIILYTTPTCAFCPLVKNFLEEKGIEYEEVDVSISEEVKNDFKEKTGQMMVPVTQIGDEIVTGFDKKRLEEALSKEG